YRATEVTYPIPVSAGKYFVISLAGTSPAIGVVLQQPDGRLARESPCWHEGRRRISEIAETSGSFTLRLNRCDEQQSGRPFEIAISEADSISDDRLRVVAERLSAEAESLIAEYTTDSRLTALHKYEEALKNWKAARDRIEEAITLARLGELHGELGQTSIAMDYLNQALAVSASLQYSDVQSDTLTARSIMFRRTGDLDAARSDADRAFQLSQTLSDRSAQAKALYTLGEVSYFSSEYTAAVDHYSHALGLWQAVGNLQGEAQSLLALG